MLKKSDLIKEPDKLMKVKFEKRIYVWFAVPSYGGRIPSVVTDMFRKSKGKWYESNSCGSIWKP